MPKTKPLMKIPCPWGKLIGCDALATVKPCGGQRIRGAKHSDYHWHCDCSARGFFSKAHFALLDKKGLLSLDEPARRG